METDVSITQIKLCVTLPENGNIHIKTVTFSVKRHVER